MEIQPESELAEGGKQRMSGHPVEETGIGWVGVVAAVNCGLGAASSGTEQCCGVHCTQHSQQCGVMKGNFRTIKGNPLPPVQPSLGN